MNSRRKWRRSFGGSRKPFQRFVRAACFSKRDRQLRFDCRIAQRAECFLQTLDRIDRLLLHQQSVAENMQRLWLAWIFI